MEFIPVLVLLGIFASPVYCQGNHSVFLAFENYLETTGLQFHDQCMKESGADPALVELLEKQTKWTNDDKLKCYAQCQGIKAKVLDENGVIDIDALKKILKATNQNFLDMAESHCKFPKHPHLCEAAYLTSVCIIDILSDHHHLH